MSWSEREAASGENSPEEAMSRILVFTVLLAALTAVASSQPAQAPDDRPVEKKAAVKGKAAATDALPTARSIVAALIAPVNFAGEKDPKRTLAQVLDDLTKKHHISYTINERAFKFEMLNDVARTEVANPEALPAMRTTLGKVIGRILMRVPVPSGATFLVREDGIEITTGQMVAAEITIERQQPPKAAPAAAPAAGVGIGMAPGLLGGAGAGIGMVPGLVGGGAATDEEEVKKFSVAVVSVAVERGTLEEAFQQMRSQANLNIVLDPALGEKGRTAITITLLNAPLDSAVRVLTEMAELDYVWLDNIFYITTREKAQRLRTSWPGRHAGGGGMLVITGAGGGM
jgi:hypothetical protein